jgi:hypothetical protein
MTRVARMFLPLIVLCGCELAPLPPPTIESVEPANIPEGSPSVLMVRVSAVPLYTLDYEEGTAETSAQEMTLIIAGQAADIAWVEQDGTLIAEVPAGLSLGAHEVQVSLADGREAMREQAFSVVPASPLGDFPEDPSLDLIASGVTGFEIDPIGEQRVGVPFTVTIRAVGPKASTFQKPVALRGSKGPADTVSAGTFQEGIRVETISLSHPGRTILLVEDADGRRGLSERFLVQQR